MKKLMVIIIALFTTISINPNITMAESKLDTPSINSEAAIVLEANTGKVLYEKNAEKSMYPASLTKIATAIYAIENGDLNDTVTVSEKAYNTGGSSVFLEEGDEATLKQLIQGLLLNSGNDAGVAIAEHLSGSVEQFSKDLNAYLEEKAGVEQTEFQNPHGLFDSEHRTTAKDLADITKYAQENETFNEIYGLETLDWDGEKWDATLYTHHRFMREDPYEGVTGGKTGYVPQSGFTLATSASRENMDVVVITMKSSTKDLSYEDTKKLLDYGFEHYQTSVLKPEEELPNVDEDYQLPKEISYTHLKGDSVNTDMDESGMLSITNSDGEEIYSEQMEKVKEKTTPPEEKQEYDKPKWQEYWTLFIFPRHFWVTEIYEELHGS
ncbi:D-alanyl-D-alanine carboxypeptidase family protein [Halobacillus litoralis]|uniref:D-alanyl-D-alanine carboxypeptidase family protein n=1 Tax=Halobacillus litoralis TaxID=45668 RepID=UPI001CFD406F|nr:D-alanyl-D-alanine carboxypeptidase family protein [Halobacillus litoralis]WLR47478.1 D-alanyl-D-alanine carboxypeptidase family protein [Halobacillus litoralis]